MVKSRFFIQNANEVNNKHLFMHTIFDASVHNERIVEFTLCTRMDNMH